MTKLEEMRDATARNAVGAALEAARESYEEIARARDELNEMEASDVYQPGHVEERRREAAERVRVSVEGLLAGARGKVGRARSTVEGRLRGLTAVGPDRLAAARGQISMLLGNLREDPGQLLAAYEQSFGVPEDRRAIEELAERALRVLPDTPERGMFEERWNRLRERLEEGLPAEHRRAKDALAELERADAYLDAVGQATAAAAGELADPRRGGNLTAFSRAYAYEREVAGESAIGDRLPPAAGLKAAG